jgi:hypothetical protein
MRQRRWDGYTTKTAVAAQANAPIASSRQGQDVSGGQAASTALSAAAGQGGCVRGIFGFAGSDGGWRQRWDLRGSVLTKRGARNGSFVWTISNQRTILCAASLDLVVRLAEGRRSGFLCARNLDCTHLVGPVAPQIAARITLHHLVRDGLRRLGKGVNRGLANCVSQRVLSGHMH